MDHSDIKIIKLADPLSVAEYAANIFCQLSDDAVAHNNEKHIALSGGSTPALLFKLLVSEKYRTRINWKKIHFWWGDERSVPPDSPDSNFGNAHLLIFSKIDFPSQNIHRIKGELDPDLAADLYQDEILRIVPKIENIPAFDWVLLGMGEDGHTASIFDTKTQFKKDALTAVTTHPVTMQKRITLTPRMIQSSKRITFLVTGREKSDMVKKIHQKDANDPTCPAGEIVSSFGITEWVVNAEAGSQL